LQVQSIPAGAAVFVNQKYAGETPLVLSGVRAGSNVVWVERSGYERWTGGVLVPTGEVARLLVNLTKANPPR